MKKVVLCGGGTGGHVFPSVAVGEVLREKDCDLYYLGVIGKIEEDLAEDNNIDFYGYEFSGFPRRLQKELLTWPFNLLRAISKAKLYLRHFKPDIVFGTGGYSSAPVFIAAKRLNIPYIVHNLDFRLGLANKFCASGAEVLTLGFESPDAILTNKNYIVTGNPVRKQFLEIENIKKETLYKEFGLDPNKKTIFVIGGSQGASAINDFILEILKELILGYNIQIIHQTGEATHDAFIRRLPAKVLETTSYIAKPFFENPEKCYHISDLVISRSGAMTTTEVTTLGKPTIFIPYPFAGNHQEANALPIVNASGAILFRQKELRSRVLLNAILNLFNNPEKLEEMSRIMKSFAKPNACEDIADLILKKIEERNNNPRVRGEPQEPEKDLMAAL